MSLLGFSSRALLSRLDAAAAENIAAQKGLRATGEETAASATAARRMQIQIRWDARKAARRLREAPMHTSDVRAAIEGVLSRPRFAGMHRPEGRS